MRKIVILCVFITLFSNLSFAADSKLCIGCMRCVKQCPKNARKVNGLMVSIAGMAIKKACSVRKENELYL